MINFNRVWAMVLRDFYNLRHSLDRLTDMFYWPLMDLVIWGLTGLYFARISSGSPHAVEIILNGLIFWLIIWRAQYELNISLLSELWDRNIVNIFASPLKIEEWIISAVLFGFLKMIISLCFIASLALLLYHYNIFIYGLSLLPVIASLLMTGLVVGFLVSGFIIRYGQKIQTFAWTGVALIMPFSAPFYTLSTLPSWAQKIAAFLPSSYIFEGMRQSLFTQTFSLDKFIISFGLNFIYLILSILFFLHMFNQSKKLGLGRLI